MCCHSLLIDYQARWPWIGLFCIRAFHLPLSHCLGEVLEGRMFRDSLTSQCRQFTGAPSWWYQTQGIKFCLGSAQLISKSAHWNSTLVLVGFPEPGSVDFTRQRCTRRAFIFSWVLPCLMPQLRMTPNAGCPAGRRGSSGTASALPSSCFREESSWVTTSCTSWLTSKPPRSWHPGGLGDLHRQLAWTR